MGTDRRYSGFDGTMARKILGIVELFTLDRVHRGAYGNVNHKAILETRGKDYKLRGRACKGIEQRVQVLREF
jgi:hypothetical protein